MLESEIHLVSGLDGFTLHIKHHIMYKVFIPNSLIFAARYQSSKPFTTFLTNYIKDIMNKEYQIYLLPDSLAKIEKMMDGIF